MKMIFKEIGTEPYIMNVIALTNWNYFTGYRRKPMVVRIFFCFGNHYASLSLSSNIRGTRHRICNAAVFLSYNINTPTIVG